MFLCVANQKGGVGKTATVYHLGHALAGLGRRVLMIDLDPQASLTMACGIEEAQGRSVAEVMGGHDDGDLALADVALPVADGLELAPSDIALAGNELGLVQRLGREQVLKQALAGARGYDVIIIDCPPNLGQLTINALVASDRVLIPTIADYLSLRGLLLFLDTLGIVRRRLNPELQVLGVLATMYNGRLVHARDVIAAMERNGIRVLPMRIPRSVRVAEALLAHKPIMAYDPDNPASVAYGDPGRWINDQTA